MSTTALSTLLQVVCNHELMMILCYILSVVFLLTHLPLCLDNPSRLLIVANGLFFTLYYKSNFFFVIMLLYYTQYLMKWMLFVRKIEHKRDSFGKIYIAKISQPGSISQNVIGTEDHWLVVIKHSNGKNEIVHNKGAVISGSGKFERKLYRGNNKEYYMGLMRDDLVYDKINQVMALGGTCQEYSVYAAVYLSSHRTMTYLLSFRILRFRTVLIIFLSLLNNIEYYPIIFNFSFLNEVMTLIVVLDYFYIYARFGIRAYTPPLSITRWRNVEILLTLIALIVVVLVRYFV
jgi:hypothetical protein